MSALAIPMVGVASGLAAAPADRARVLPVHDELAHLFPWGGLRRGGTVAVRGSTSLLLALLAEATANGSWAAVVGLPDLGVLAAAEYGVAVDRLALVPRPGNQWPQVVAALLDGIDLVAVATGARESAATTRAGSESAAGVWTEERPRSPGDRSATREDTGLRPRAARARDERAQSNAVRAGWIRRRRRSLCSTPS